MLVSCYKEFWIIIILLRFRVLSSFLLHTMLEWWGTYNSVHSTKKCTRRETRQQEIQLKFKKLFCQLPWTHIHVCIFQLKNCKFLCITFFVMNNIRGENAYWKVYEKNYKTIGGKCDDNFVLHSLHEHVRDVCGCGFIMNISQK